MHMDPYDLTVSRCLELSNNSADLAGPVLEAIGTYKQCWGSVGLTRAASCLQSCKVALLILLFVVHPPL